MKSAFKLIIDEGKFVIEFVSMKIEEEIKQKSFLDSIHKVTVNVLFTYNWLRDRHLIILKPYGILPQHYNVLRILRGRYPEIASPGEIKEVILDKGPDVTRLLDKLVKNGFIERKQCESNRRKVDVRITENGLKMLDELDIVMVDYHKDLGDKISDEEATILSNLLDKLRD